MRIRTSWTLALIALATGCSFSMGPDSWSANSRGPGVKGSGHSSQEVREVGPFSSMRVSGNLGVEVVVEPDQDGEVVVHGDDNLMEYIRTEVDDGVLEIEVRRSVRPKSDLWVSVSAARLDGVSLAGSGEVTVRGIEGREFDISLGGSGDIDVSGRVEGLSVSLTGSGDIDADGLVADDVEVSIAGSGDVDVQARESLDVSIAGSGDVRYRGRPRLSISRAGSGDVSSRR